MATEYVSAIRTWHRRPGNLGHGGSGNNLEFDPVKQGPAVPTLEGPEAGNQFILGVEAEKGKISPPSEKPLDQTSGVLRPGR
ncbi:hypothetical protein MASR1M32_08830 [Rhodobacter sp.]